MNVCGEHKAIVAVRLRKRRLRQFIKARLNQKLAWAWWTREKS